MTKKFEKTVRNKEKKKKGESTVWNKEARKSKNTDTVWNKEKKNSKKFTDTKWEKSIKSNVVWHKEKKKKFSNKNKKAEDLKNISDEWLVEKYTPATQKKDYKVVAYESRWLDMDFEVHRFCEITYELTGEKINAEEIHHIEGRNGSKFNDPSNLIFVCRKEHDIVSKYEIQWLKDIVQKYLIY